MTTSELGSRVSVGLTVVVVTCSMAACARQEVTPAGGAAPTTIEFELAENSTLEEVFNSTPRVVDVQPCNAGSDCIACNEAGKQGLKVQDKTTVHCKGAAGKFCAHGGAQIRWDFKGGGIQPKSEYRATVQYSSTATKLTAGKTAYQKAYCRDASGNSEPCVGAGLGKNLTVFSGLPELAGSAGALETTYWPHRLDLYEVTESGETLIACADPEIIVDPPGGGGSVVPP